MTNQAGGIWNSGGGTVNITDSTIGDNTAALSGGGIWNQSGTVQLLNTIVAGNSASNLDGPDIRGTATDDGYNLIGNTSGSSGFTASTDQLNVSADLSALGNYGGLTQTLAPLPGSPAIAAGDPGQAGTTAQNGVVRPSASVDIGAAQDPTFVVNTTSDSDDGSATGATISLRDAIEYGANATSGTSVIAFDPTVFDPANGPYTITLVGSELPQITGSLEISGPGDATLGVSGNNQSRIFDIGSTASVVISGLTIEDGNGQSASGVGASNGGAILNAGTLTLADSTVSGSTATGSLVNYGYGPRAAGGAGGGISNQSGAYLVLSNSVVTGNKAYGFNSGGHLIGASGGGIRNFGNLQVVGSTVSNNTAYHVAYGTGYSGGFGGGIFSNSDSPNPLTISDSTISDNTAQGTSGGIFSFVRTGNVAITDSTISGNKAPGAVGIWSYGEHGTSMAITGSTIANNTATGNYGYAGGIWTGGSPLTVTDSTIADNSAYQVGAIYVNSSTLTLLDSTVTGNSASGRRGGIYIEPPYASLTLQNTILAGNTSPTAPDLADTGTVTDNGHNLLGTALRGTVSGTGDVFSDSPALSSLGSYGGSTQTLEVLPGSPALAAGDPSQAGTTAQNGVVRVASAVDIGAAEDPYIVVNTTADRDDSSLTTGTISLRDAIEYGADANPSGITVIVFDPSLAGQTILLGGTELPQITGEVAIAGPGAGLLAVSGGGLSRVFDIGSAATVGISGLTIEDGYLNASGGGFGNTGGGIFNRGTLTLTDSTVSGNHARLGGAILSYSGGVTLIDSTVSGNSAQGGGGIYNTSLGTLTLNDSTVSNNSCSVNWGGGISNWGGTLTLNDSTVTGNTAAFAGGGIYNLFSGSLTVTNSTISGNTAVHGGGINFGGFYSGQSGPLSVSDSIIAGNTASGSAPDLNGSITTDNGYNLLGTAVQGATTATDAPATNNPLLAPLGYYGGPTETMALLPGSPALGTGAPSGPDQRGFAASTDIGAFQTQSSLVVNTADDTASGAEPSGELSLRDAINLANADGGGTITFASALTGDTITLSGTELPPITSNTTITGPGAGNLAVSGDNASRIFDIASGATVSISGLTIEDGNSVSQGGQGGGIRNDGTLTLSNSTVSGSFAESGGGIYNNVSLHSASALILIDNTISGNSAAFGGGICNSNNGTLTLTGTTVSGNTSSGDAGGIDNFGMAMLTDSIVSGNSAVDGGGLWNLNVGTLTLMGCTVSSNSASTYGGGILNDGGSLALTSTTVSANTAAVSGGGIENDSGTATLTDSTLSGNQGNSGVASTQTAAVSRSRRQPLPAIRPWVRMVRTQPMAAVRAAAARLSAGPSPSPAARSP